MESVHTPPSRMQWGFILLLILMALLTGAGLSWMALRPRHPAVPTLPPVSAMLEFDWKALTAKCGNEQWTVQFEMPSANEIKSQKESFEESKADRSIHGGWAQQQLSNQTRTIVAQTTMNDQRYRAFHQQFREELTEYFKGHRYTCGNTSSGVSSQSHLLKPAKLVDINWSDFTYAYTPPDGSPLPFSGTLFYSLMQDETLITLTIRISQTNYKPQPR